MSKRVVFVWLVSVAVVGSAVVVLRSYFQDERPEVLIYYSNETAPTPEEGENYRQMIAWLNSGNIEHQKAAATLNRDLDVFHQEVDAELTAIGKHLSTSRQGPNVVIFTNRLARSGSMLVSRVGESKFHSQSFTVDESDNYISQSNPLASPATFKQALQSVMEHFDPHKYRYVLITKSHGNQELAMTPRLVVRHEETDREEILGLFKGDLDEDELPEWTKVTLGTTKEDYFAVLSELGKSHGMQFSLVVMESCKSSPSETGGDYQLPSNVDHLLATLGLNCEYYSFDYGEVLTAAARGQGLQQAFAENRPEYFGAVAHANPLGRLWMYYLPLLLVVGTILLRRLRWSQNLRLTNCFST